MRMVAATGEPHLLRSIDLLEGTLARPQNRWRYENVDDIAALATSLLFGVTRNHPFAQVIDWGFVLVDDISCAEHIIDVINGVATEQSFSDHLRDHICPAANG